MKKLFSILVITSFIYGCSGNESPETHTHEDGTIHEAHGDDHSHEAATNEQEEFSVSDTSKTQEHDHEHSHEDDHTHEGDHKH